MAATTGAAVAAELLAAGLPDDTGRRRRRRRGAGQAVLHTDLGRWRRAREPLPGPCVLVIGAVAARCPVRVAVVPDFTPLVPV